MSETRSHTASPFARALGMLCVGLVLALGVFGSSADLHAALHDHEHADSAHAEGLDQCAVAVFAAGVSLPVDSAAVDSLPVAVSEPALVTFAASPWSDVEHRLPPERGPPRG